MPLSRPAPRRRIALLLFLLPVLAGLAAALLAAPVGFLSRSAAAARTAVPPRSAAAAAARPTATSPISLAAAGVGYTPPLPGALRVSRGFAPPSTPYGPGHLGVDLAASPGAAVISAAAGTVRFAGMVAGRGVVVIAHPDGLSTEYEPLASRVQVGQAVVGRQLIGVVAGHHDGCLVMDCLHWGARRGTTYLDPLSLLRPLGVVRLLPWQWPP